MYENSKDASGVGDVKFLKTAFHKLLINFTWWVNRKDPMGNNLFAGGFLGLDNIGVFDRSKPLPTGGHLEQADGTSWMGFFCASMLQISLELAVQDSSYEDMANKFFEHFIQISDAMNNLGGTGLWDEEDGFYYDVLRMDDGDGVPLKVRSMVGLIPLYAVVTLTSDMMNKLPSFSKRVEWFMTHKTHLASQVTVLDDHNSSNGCARLLALPSMDRM